MVARSSFASSTARAEGSTSATGSTSSHSTSPVPTAARVTVARRSARITSAGVPFGSAPRFSMVATTPTVA